MKPIYNNIGRKTGVQISGICKLQIAPLSKVNSSIITDYTTGNVTTAVNIIGGFFELEFLENTIKFSEKYKTSKAGGYFDVNIQGSLSAIDKESRVILESFRFESLLVIITFPDKTKRIIGNNEKGMTLSFSNDANNISNPLVFDLIMQRDNTVPYYIV